LNNYNKKTVHQKTSLSLSPRPGLGNGSSATISTSNVAVGLRATSLIGSDYGEVGSSGTADWVLYEKFIYVFVWIVYAYTDDN
jgi:hypothetical protein